MSLDAVIAGIGIIPFGKFLNRSSKTMSEEVTRLALNDANIETRDINMVFFGNAASGFLTGQECIKGQAALRNTGLLGVPIVNIENACASSSSAFNLAYNSVTSGQNDIVLVIGIEKMNSSDRLAPNKALEASADLDELEQFKKRILVNKPESNSIFMDLYSDLAKKYMTANNISDINLAEIAVKQRNAGSFNINAQFQNKVSIEEVMNSRMISDPLRLMMCSPISDGACAIVLMNRKIALKKSDNLVNIESSVLKSGNGKAEDNFDAVSLTAKQAYELASIGPNEIEVVELHDAASPAEFIISEQLGFCKRGDALSLFKSGKTSIGGTMPINPSGGLISRGHPIGATGAAQIVEITKQLRNQAGKMQREDARIGLAENAGGWIGNDVAATCVTILSS